MIFVILGTQDSPFPRIIDRVLDAKKQLDLEDEIFVQKGTTLYTTPHAHVQDYYEQSEYRSLLKTARVIVTHGGAGTIFQALELGKKIIVMPRNSEFGEHNDNHQFELTKKLANEKYILFAEDDLRDALSKINDFKNKPYQKKNSIQSAVESFIDSL
ncbi:MAG: hypothetical protein LBD38_00355 [Streptococcaceae bacterium]|jgi:UDP-N-acetylglucosamine transferase subunit ALG13|nr:hypothetical protein [Streptococcaceae bacterium]